MLKDFLDFFTLTGFPEITWQMPVMWVVCLVLFYLAVYKGFEPLLLVPIAFGALLANLPAPRQFVDAHLTKRHSKLAPVTAR